MSRTVQLSVILTLLAGMACLLAAPVIGEPLVAFNYAKSSRTFKVCLLLLESQKNSSGSASYWNPDPWFLPVLNHSPYKPAGWTLDNPLAQSVLVDDSELIKSGDEYSKDGKGGGSSSTVRNWYLNGKSVGDSINKADPAYWAVKLDDKSIDALSSFDLLIVNGHNESTLSDTDRSRLNLLVEHGATIWINNSQRSGMEINNFFVDPPLQFAHDPNGSYTDESGTSLQAVDGDSWLLNSFYRLSAGEVNTLRDNTSRYSYISDGIAGPGMSSLISEVVRLMPGSHPAIGAGRVGNGEVIATGTDVIGGTSDWWENKHNKAPTTFTDLDAWPYSPSMHLSALGDPNSYYVYVSCVKFVFNMLNRPASWHMVGGNSYATRFFPQSFSSALSQGWTAHFLSLCDPVTYGNYAALTGWSTEQGRNELRLYYLNDSTSLNAMSGIAAIPMSVGYTWMGSPVFGRVTIGTAPVTVLYAMEGHNNGDTWTLRLHCYRVDKLVELWQANSANYVSADLWAADPPSITADGTDNDTPAATPTISNGRLVVTLLGEASGTNDPRIFIIDGKSGAIRARVGTTPEYNAKFKLTGPASLVTAQVEFQLRDKEMNLTATTTTDADGIKRQLKLVELLAVTGIYSGKTSSGTQAAAQPALFLIPPMAVVSPVDNVQQARSDIPDKVEICEHEDGVAVDKRDEGDFTNLTPANGLLAVKPGGRVLKILFTTWDVFFKKGENDPLYSLPMDIKCSYNQRDTSKDPIVVTDSDVQLYMGYPIILKGTKTFNLDSPLTYQDDDGYNYAVNAPLTVAGDKIIVGTNYAQRSGFATLKGSRNQFDLQNIPTVIVSGSLTAYRIGHPSFSLPGIPVTPGWRGDVAWQFFGDTLGPRGAEWHGKLPAQWVSAFPYPAAVGKDTVYAVARYLGSSPLYRSVSSDSSSDITASKQIGMLYAIDPSPSRYLEQVVTAGRLASGNTATNTLSVTLNAPLADALRVGARVLLRWDDTVWDAGRVTAIVGTANPYTIAVDRNLPTDGTAYPLNNTASLLVATSVPYVSHVQGWDAVAGAKPILQWNEGAVTRVSSGVLNSYPEKTATTAADPANPDPVAMTQGEMMVSFTNLPLTCHQPNTIVDGTVVPDNDDSSFLPTNWQQELPQFLYLPRTPLRGQINSVTGEIELNYEVDYRTGRVQLSPEAAGEYADRFVVVHYFTSDYNAASGKTEKKRHAEIMHIPSPVKWQYQFAGDIVPDSGPVVVNDTVYVTAERAAVNNQWQPTLFTFAAHPTNANDVQPIRQQAVGTTLSTAAGTPYRAVTTPTPTPNGVLVGTAVRVGDKDQGAAKNALTLFSDRGILIADGHRILRVNGDGQTTWQASATKMPDPAVLNSGGADDDALASGGMVQQAFTLITRIHRLDNGNVLACDTGGNRVVEMDRFGNVVWQYPDSDIANADTPAAERTVTPQQLRLNGPRDVRRYQRVNQVVVNGVMRYVRWDITLIADSGNNRLIEVYRPSVYFDNSGYTYSPTAISGNVTLRQFAEVVADGNTLGATTSPAITKPMTFTVAMRFPTETNALPDTENSVLDGVRSKEFLAVVGNTVNEPSAADKFVRTVRLIRATVDPASTGIYQAAPNASVNVLRVRANSPYDFTGVRQLDLVRLYDQDGNQVTHVLVVDQVGVREIMLEYANQPLAFEMRQKEYSQAIRDANWYSIDQATGAVSATSVAGRNHLSNSEIARLNAWREDTLFAPVSVLRIDPGSLSTKDQPNVRYLIAQLNSIANPNTLTWVGGKSVPRIHLFEARYGDSNDPDTVHDWWIVSHDGYANQFVFPTPWSEDFPNLPGTTYPLSQPLSIDRD